MKQRGKHVYARDIAILVSDQGLDAAVAKYGEITPARARDVVDAMVEAGVTVIPESLADLAGRARPYNPRHQPEAGEDREYVVLRNLRVSASVSHMGMKEGSIARVRYEKDRVIITRPKPRK
jgi:hypothetical protein